MLCGYRFDFFVRLIMHNCQVWQFLLVIVIIKLLIQHLSGSVIFRSHTRHRCTTSSSLPLCINKRRRNRSERGPDKTEDTGWPLDNIRSFIRRKLRDFLDVTDGMVHIDLEEKISIYSTYLSFDASLKLPFERLSLYIQMFLLNIS